MAREKSPNAPKWRNIEVTPCPRGGGAFCMKAFNMSEIYQLCWTIVRTVFAPPGATPWFVLRGMKDRAEQEKAEKHWACGGSDPK
jgi:hypothetical protein